MSRVLVLAGSARAGSFNKKLARAALAAIERCGGDATLVDLADHRMPLYDGDLEASQGLPEAAVRLRELFLAHRGLWIATPEYNGSIPPLLKNTIDWLTRSPRATPDLATFQGKVAALTSASPGPLGGLRAVNVVRELLFNLGVTVLPGPVTIRAAHEAFDEHDALDERRTAALDALARRLLEALPRA